MTRRTLCIFAVMVCLTSCAIPIERADWCVVKGGLRVSVPLDRGVEYQKEKCRSKEVWNKLFN